MRVPHESLRRVLIEGLKLDHPYQPRHEVPQADFSSASVLLLFALDRNDEVHLLFVKRAQHVRVHQGQMAFPGGRWEESDQGSGSQAALRETQEEVGVSSDRIEILGRLPLLHTITGYEVGPFVGCLVASLEEVELQVDREELDEAIWLPIRELTQAEVYREECVSRDHVQYLISIFTVRNYTIWGATGSMTKNILERIHQFSG